MKRLSLSELKARQAELSRKIEEAEEREKNIIGEYMQKITGEYELNGIKKWLQENISKKNEERERNGSDVKMYAPLNVNIDNTLL